MPNQRRYRDEEVAAILEAAASESTPAREAPSPEGGLSLAELQAIGRQVGIAPVRIAEAAAALDLQAAAVPRQTQLGVPVAVGRTMELPRPPSEREWQLLVSELRATFHAHGKDRSLGDLRAWTNGNLHVYIEPTENAHRLRMGTLSDSGVMLGRMSAAFIALGVLLLVLGLVTGEFASPVGGPLFLIFAAVAAMVANAVRLPRWAEEREAQMEHIASRARTLIGGDAPAAEPGTGS